MTKPTIFRRVRRQIAFAAAVPPRQVARRLWLGIQRRVERAVAPSLDVKGVRVVTTPPLPIFEPRTHLAEAVPQGWHFFLIGTDIALPHHIDWGAPLGAFGDQLWRMNLHYMEYLEGLSDIQFCDVVAQWLAANPAYAPGADTDAWHAYTISLRVVVWMQQLAARASTLPGSFLARANESLASQVRYLERHLETDIGGNHVIKNCKALLWASTYFDGPAAAIWRRKGLRLLSRELPEQILCDGMHFERSPSYHCQVLADLLEIRHALGTDPLGGRLDLALARATQVVANLTHPDGYVAQFGDSGLNMAYLPERCLSAYAAISGARPTAQAAFAIPDGGFYGARHGNTYLVVDAGPISAEALPAHGHGDMLSFEWSLDGQRFIIDQGVFEYVAGERRTAARSSASHNTVALRGMDQAEFFGAFRCGRRAKIEVLRVEETFLGFSATARHDGFQRIFGGPLHTRRLTMTGRSVRVEDWLEPAPTSPARASFLLHPSATVDRLPSGDLRIACGEARALLRASAEVAIEPACWWPDMGVEVPAIRLVLPIAPGATSCWVEITGIETISEGTDF